MEKEHTSRPDIRAALYRSPAGELCVGEIDGRICLCDWTRGTGHPRPGVLKRLLRHTGAREIIVDKAPASALLREAFRQLDAYFSGTLTEFTLPVLMAGTPFQRRIWERLLLIPYGSAIRYADLCPESPERTRAAANAVGANPMSIILPCHRVCRKPGSGTTHTGYAGGIQAKMELLRLEATVSQGESDGC
ncbi:MAG: methylated-DNA--[protein]-cysteine S-methyltransferase [Muribaculaceae bacterium]|nr:methylated-DNA--[protein]-cysteine S-methyltransferase [Muribaculaceae bacterium]